MEYLRHVPTTVPTGKIVVHNHVEPRKTLGVGGFRAWLDEPADVRALPVRLGSTPGRALQTT